MFKMYLVQICDTHEKNSGFFQIGYLFAAQLFNKDSNVLPLEENPIQICHIWIVSDRVTRGQKRATLVLLNPPQ